MEKLELSHILERVTIAILNGPWHKIKKINHPLHGLLLNTAQILMRDLHLLMEKQEQFHIQEKDITATLNGHWFKEVHMYKKHQKNLNYAHSHYKEHTKISILMIRIHSQNHSHFQDIIAI